MGSQFRNQSEIQSHKMKTMIFPLAQRLDYDLHFHKSSSICMVKRISALYIGPIVRCLGGLRLVAPEAT